MQLAQRAYRPQSSPQVTFPNLGAHPRYFMPSIPQALLLVQIPDHVVSQDFVDEHCFMPAHPLCRSLPKFAADKSASSEGKSCNKFYKKHPGLTPGLFKLFCAHRRCIGFSLMADQEGPSTAFQLIYNRFKTGKLSDQYPAHLLLLS